MLRYLHFLFPTFCSHCSVKHTPSRLPLCGLCREELTLIDPQYRCRRCFSLLEDNTSALCSECLNKTPLFSAAAAFERDSPARVLLYAFLKGHRRDLAKDLAAFMVLQLSRLSWCTFDALIPIPSSPLNRRGYQPSFLISKELSKLTSIPMLQALKADLLLEPQGKKSYLERKELSSLFYLKKEVELVDKNILLIDDLMVTRQTLTRCSEALFKALPSRIHAITFLA